MLPQRSHIELRQPTPRARIPSIHWLFRSNIPRRRASYLAPDIQKRNFFGMSEIIGVITNVSRFHRSVGDVVAYFLKARGDGPVPH